MNDFAAQAVAQRPAAIPPLVGLSSSPAATASSVTSAYAPSCSASSAARSPCVAASRFASRAMRS